VLPGIGGVLWTSDGVPKEELDQPNLTEEVD
jgi:hypothetical protein